MTRPRVRPQLAKTRYSHDEVMNRGKYLRRHEELVNKTSRFLFLLRALLKRTGPAEGSAGPNESSREPSATSMACCSGSRHMPRQL